MINYLKTSLKGFLIGSADVVPGVSGGTMALILGIYARLIKAIMSVNAEVLGHFLKLRWKKAFGLIDLSFLVPLLIGVVTALLLMSRVLRYLIEQYPVQIWTVFFGFVLSSALTLFWAIKKKSKMNYATFVIGTFIGFMIVGLTPVQPEITWLYLFFSGFVAIVAMILPGISGSFILVILGSYYYILGCITNPFNAENLISIAIVGAGAVIGIAGFSRGLNYALEKFPELIMALMTGFMLGSLRKIWPWKLKTESVGADGKSMIAESNVLPPQFDMAFAFVVLLLVLSLVIGYWMAKKSGGIDGMES